MQHKASAAPSLTRLSALRGSAPRGAALGRSVRGKSKATDSIRPTGNSAKAECANAAELT